MYKQKFEEFCKDTFMDGDNKGSKTISRAKGENIILGQNGSPLFSAQSLDCAPKYGFLDCAAQS